MIAGLVSSVIAMYHVGRLSAADAVNAVSGDPEPGHPEKSLRPYDTPSLAKALAKDKQGRTGFVCDWLVLGAMPSPGGRKTWQEPVTPELLRRGANFRKDMLTAAGGETEVQPWLGQCVTGEDGKPYVWQSITADVGSGRVNLGERFKQGGKIPEHVLAYLACYLKFDEEKTAIVSIGSNDGFKLWINGEFIEGRHVFRGASVDDDLMLVRFRTGVNLMLLKITQDVGGWEAVARLMDKGYKPLADVSELVIPAGDVAMHSPARVRGPSVATSAPPSTKPVPAAPQPPEDPTRAPVVNRVRLFPAPGFADRLAGGRIIGSNSGQTVGFVELAKVTAAPTADQWVELRFENNVPYRWIKYEGPEKASCMVAEIELYEGPKRIGGQPFGISGKTESRDYEQAFDGRTDTWYEASLDSTAYLGLDLGTPANISAPPALTPKPGRYAAPQQLLLSVSDPAAQIRYTTDGSLPTATVGRAYSGPIPLEKGFIPLTAVALEKGKFPSVLLSETYTIGDVPPPKGLVTLSFGNSLTDTFGNYLQPVARSAGYDHKGHLHTWMGVPTDAIWNHPAMAWQGSYLDQFKKIAPIDIITTQPFYVLAQPVDREADYTGKFYALARENSPSVQLYLYQTWPGRFFTQGDAWAMLSLDYMKPIAQRHGLTPAESWEQAATNHIAYFETLREKLQSQFPGKPILIVPAGLAMANLKKAYEAGQVPGAARERFFEVHSAEKNEKGQGTAGHLTEPGRYFVSLVLYCCFYKESPDRVKLPANMTKLTPEQDKVYKKIAWETVKSYPYAGVLPLP